MRTWIVIIAAIIMALTANAVAYQSIQELYNQAQPYGEYDKFIQLDPAVEYLGDLRIAPGVRVCLNGQGAIIHGRPSLISVGVHGYIDISGCVLANGLGGIYFSDQGSGNIHSNTISGCTDAAIRTFHEYNIPNLSIWDNIITNCNYGVFSILFAEPSYISHNTMWLNQQLNYAHFCPT